MASEIKFVSFKNLETQYGETYTYASSIPKLNGKVDIEKLLEIKTANTSEINSLTDILFNYDFKEKNNTIEPGCYEPRNAILFLNPKGEIVEYLEICFQCYVMLYGNKKLDAVNRCYIKVDLVKKLFSSNGIKFGVSEK